ncbi:signal recognition particle-docking protein FtsY, partial [Pseudomonas amygdali pv. morsprunorum]
MFGSNDDKKTPAEAGEKKGLFGWLRKKPQQAEPAPQESSPTQPDPVHDPVVITPQVEPAVASQSVPESIVEPVANSQQGHVKPGAPSPQPWLTLPVTEEPVALSDEREPHITPPIPEQSQAHAMPEPVAAQPVADIVPLSVPEPLLVQPVPEPEPVVAQAVPQPVAPVPQVVPALAPAPVQEPETGKVGFFARLKQGLSKTSASIGEGMASLFLGKKAIDDDLLEEIETRLLTADVGVEATSVIIKSLTQKVARKQLTDAQALYTSLQGELAAMLKPVEQPLVIKAEHK